MEDPKAADKRMRDEAIAHGIFFCDVKTQLLLHFSPPVAELYKQAASDDIYSDFKRGVPASDTAARLIAAGPPRIPAHASQGFGEFVHEVYKRLAALNGDEEIPKAVAALDAVGCSDEDLNDLLASWLAGSTARDEAEREADCSTTLPGERGYSES